MKVTTDSQTLYEVYHFTFSNASSLTSQLSEDIKDQLVSMDLMDSSAAAEFEVTSTNPFTIDVFVPVEADDSANPSLLAQPSVIFTNPSQSDDPQIGVITHKGAIRNPPAPADPLP